MHAAVVHVPGQPPLYEQYPDPEPAGPDEVVVEVLASALHPRVRSGAAGTHYADSAAGAFIPGIDGVGLLPDGRRVYFLSLDTPRGSMAERIAVSRRRCIPLPPALDPVTVAAALNPAISSWSALRRRAHLQAGQSVLVLGATGSAGQAAVHLAKRLGAGRVVAAGRDQDRLDATIGLGADATVSLNRTDAAAAVAAAAADVDVVLDYLWGPVSRELLPAVLATRRSAAPLTWVSIGAVAGPAVLVESAWLRSADLRLVGQGQGAVPLGDLFEDAVSLIDDFTRAAPPMKGVAVDLADVESAWGAVDSPGTRTVFIPHA